MIVEDDEALRRLVGFHLRSAGFETIELELGEGAIEVAAREEASLVILDRMLPDIDGLDLCREIRASERLEGLGILVLTARGTESDRLDGFAAGTDDYVVKPFSVRELVARARVLSTLVEHRRQARSLAAQSPENRLYRWRGLLLDVMRHRVKLDGVEVDLRPIELTLLRMFFEAPNKTFSRTDIVSTVWGDEVPIAYRTVDVHIRRLRERLGPRFGEVIQTVHGVGYRLREE